MDNSTANQTVDIIANLLATILPLVIILAIFGAIIRTFLGSGWWRSSQLEDDSPEPTRQTFGAVEDDHVRLVHSTVTCSYCGGEAYGTELQCPHCYAPASKAFPRVEAR